MPLLEQVGDAEGDHPGLAGAGAREHQEGPLGGLDGTPLFGIQGGEQLGGRHGGAGA